MNTSSTWFQYQYRESRFFRGIILSASCGLLFVLFAAFYYPSKKIQTLILQTLQDYSPVAFHAEAVDLDLILIPNMALERGKIALQPGFLFSFKEIALSPALPSFQPTFVPQASVSIDSDLAEGSLKGGVIGASFSAQADLDRVSFSALLALIQQGLKATGSFSLQAKLAGSQGAELALNDGDFDIQSKDFQLNASGIQVPFNGVPLNVSIPAAQIGEVEIKGSISDNRITLNTLKVGNKDSSLQIEGGGQIETVFRGTSLDLVRSQADLDLGIRIKEDFAEGVKPISLSDLSRMVLGKQQQPGQWIRFQLKGSLMQPDIGLK